MRDPKRQASAASSGLPEDMGLVLKNAGPTMKRKSEVSLASSMSSSASDASRILSYLPASIPTIRRNESGVALSLMR